LKGLRSWTTLFSPGSPPPPRLRCAQTLQSPVAIADPNYFFFSLPRFLICVLIKWVISCSVLSPRFFISMCQLWLAHFLTRSNLILPFYPFTNKDNWRPFNVPRLKRLSIAAVPSRNNFYGKLGLKSRCPSPDISF